MTARQIPVLKMHGAHNEFVLIDERPERFAFDEYPEIARRLCSGRDFGISADGILVLRDSTDASAVAEMRIFNADGSEAEMCGNGVRCAARYLAERGAGDAFTITTVAGPIGAQIVAREPAFRVSVDIGPVCFPNDARDEEIDAAGERRRYVSVSLGNPHIVVFVPDAARVDLGRAGLALATHERFPEGTNVHFVQLMGRNEIVVRHYERGAGPTQACGTGAVASAAVARVRHGYASPVAVHVPGGLLEVAWDGANATLTGPAEVAFARTVAL